ncbi:hypothetical protein R3P38DRAFT_183566 [Favolaschia claudopus]|uniref:Uncharacterized protein n=1 Tax=Favolaschia claudopus TaxID=2862362 RepID=A0AAW0D3Z9_9AGAR
MLRKLFPLIELKPISRFRCELQPNRCKLHEKVVSKRFQVYMCHTSSTDHNSAINHSCSPTHHLLPPHPPRQRRLARIPNDPQIPQSRLQPQHFDYHQTKPASAIPTLRLNINTPRCSIWCHFYTPEGRLAYLTRPTFHDASVPSTAPSPSPSLMTAQICRRSIESAPLTVNGSRLQSVTAFSRVNTSVSTFAERAELSSIISNMSP